MKAEWTNKDSLSIESTGQKAVLVIDMPRSCAECTLRTSLEANYLYCIATLPRLKIDPMTASNIKEHRCPLRPLPQRIEQGYPTDDYTIGKADGWNDCIDAITRETK